MSGDSGGGFLGRFKPDFDSVFVEEWPALSRRHPGGAGDPRPDGERPVLGRVRRLTLWGDWFNHFIGLGPVLGIPAQPENPLLHRMSIMNITLVLGAFTAALLSRQFLINRPPKLEYLWAALGGILMGVGASLAGGCTTGGFFTPLLHASPAGWAMWAGLWSAR
jgi:uncharacterized protein